MPPETTNQSAGVGQEGSSFISIDNAATGGSNNNAYTEFFGDANTQASPSSQKPKQSSIELTAKIVGIIAPIILASTLLFWGYVSVRTLDSNEWISKYSFLCPLMNFGINDPDLTTDTGRCKTLGMIKTDYTGRTTELTKKISNELTEYIPIKISSNLIASAPEKKFITDTFNNKLPLDIIMKQFNRVLLDSRSKRQPNIDCTGLTIGEKGVLNTQCTIYGSEIGQDDDKSQLGSARIETLRFLANLQNTAKYGFILMNPPNSLGSDKVNTDTDGGGVFATQVSIPVQIMFVPVFTNPNI